MGILIDSGVFIRWERQGREIAFSNWVSFGEPYVSVITVSELKVGIYRANTIERRSIRGRFVKTVLSNVTVLEIDTAVADIHALIVAELTTNGTPIGPHDFWIAATALRYDFDFLTTNVKEFQRIPNLRVIGFPRLKLQLTLRASLPRLVRRGRVGGSRRLRAALGVCGSNGVN